MKFTSKYEIKEKRFTKDKIYSIAKKLFDECNSQSVDSRASITFNVSCYDNTSYSIDDLSIFDENEILDIKKVTSIKIELNIYKDNTYNCVDIEFDTTSTYNNQLKVSGEKSWATNIFNDIKNIIDSVSPQFSLFERYKNLFFYIIAFGLGSFYMLIFGLIYDLANIQGPIDLIAQKNIVIAVILKIFLSIGAGVFLGASSIQDYILKLFPNIEFDFGPEHLKKQKSKRKKLGFVFVVLIIPMILNLLNNQVNNIQTSDNKQKKVQTEIKKDGKLNDNKK